MNTVLATAWLVINFSSGAGGGAVTIPMPSYEFCQKEIARLDKGITGIGKDYMCVYGLPLNGED